MEISIFKNKSTINTGEIEDGNNRFKLSENFRVSIRR